VRRLLFVTLFGLSAALPLRAQNPVTPADSAAEIRRDSIIANRPKGDSIRPRPPITPTTAFLRSLAIPGWGQSALGRNVTGGVFAAFEGIAIVMVWKATWQLNFARTRGKYVNSHRQELQDWTVLLVFNHLMAGAEAYVSAHLYDFPVGLKMQAMPEGRTGIGVNVPF
jgi:hypothetical protein